MHAKILSKKSELMAKMKENSKLSNANNKAEISLHICAAFVARRLTNSKFLFRRADWFYEYSESPATSQAIYQGRIQDFWKWGSYV